MAIEASDGLTTSPAAKIPIGPRPVGVVHDDPSAPVEPDANLVRPESCRVGHAPGSEQHGVWGKHGAVRKRHLELAAHALDGGGPHPEDEVNTDACEMFGCQV